MLVWFVFAVMTVIGVLAVLLPLARADRAAAGAQDVAVYRDQLGEIDRDRERGVIDEVEAVAARNEVARRLLKAARAEETDAPAALGGPSRLARAVAVVCAVLIPAIAIGAYLGLGKPDAADQPLASRLAAASSEKQSIDQLVARVEKHLADRPEDGKGWEVLVPIYVRMGRLADAETALRNTIRLLGSTAERESALGEVIVYQNSGVVVADARAAFERANAQDPLAVAPRMFLALALSQDGKLAESRKAWVALIDASKPDDPWVVEARAELAKIDAVLAGGPAAVAPTSPAPPAAADKGPSAADIAAAQSMTEAERGRMIEDMIASLNARLKAQGGTVDEWIKLVRSYAMIGKRVEATTALQDARKAFAADAAAIEKLDGLAKALSL